MSLVLCVLALVLSQVFGVGYACLCSGKPVLTQATHCHGPHGGECDAGSHEEEGTREEHQSIKAELVLGAAGSAFVVAPELMALLPMVAWEPAPMDLARTLVCWQSEPPPLGVILGRSVVLLI